MNEQRCHDVEERLTDLIEGELSEREQTLIEEHLSGCASCTHERNQLEALRQGLRRDAPPDPGAAFWRTFPDQVWKAHVAQTGTTSMPGIGMGLRDLFAPLHDLFAGPRWAPVAAALIIAIGVGYFVTRSPSTELDAATYQAQIRSETNLAVLAQRAAVDAPPATQFGFANAAAGRNYFQVGHTFAEALAYAAGGDIEAARARMQALAVALGGVAPKLAEELRGEPSLAVLAAVEPKLARIARADGERSETLFRAGVSLANLTLAAVAADDDALRRTVPTIAALERDVERVKLAPGARRDLHTLTEVLARDTLSEQDRLEVRRLVRRVQAILL